MTTWLFHCKSCGAGYSSQTSPANCPHCKRYNDAERKEEKK